MFERAAKQLWAKAILTEKQLKLLKGYAEAVNRTSRSGGGVVAVGRDLRGALATLGRAVYVMNSSNDPFHEEEFNAGLLTVQQTTEFEDGRANGVVLGPYMEVFGTVTIFKTDRGYSLQDRFNAEPHHKFGSAEWWASGRDIATFILWYGASVGGTREPNDFQWSFYGNPTVLGPGP